MRHTEAHNEADNEAGDDVQGLQFRAEEEEEQMESTKMLLETLKRTHLLIVKNLYNTKF